jgi:hypothetical protein
MSRISFVTPARVEIINPEQPIRSFFIAGEISESAMMKAAAVAVTVAAALIARFFATGRTPQPSESSFEIV